MRTKSSWVKASRSAGIIMDKCYALVPFLDAREAMEVPLSFFEISPSMRDPTIFRKLHLGTKD